MVPTWRQTCPCSSLWFDHNTKKADKGSLRIDPQPCSVGDFGCFGSCKSSMASIALALMQLLWRAWAQVNDFQ